jgi:hypothetical protein
MQFENREERNNWRIKRLNELLGYLTTRYEHNERSYTDFTVKIKDVRYLLENFMDVLEDSNLYTSVSTEVSTTDISTDNFKIEIPYYNMLEIKTKDYDAKNNFKIHIDMDQIKEITFNVNGGTIFSIRFKHQIFKYDYHLSFRND